MLGVVGELDRLRRLGNVLEIEAGQLGDDLEQVQSEAGLRLLPGSLGPSGTEEIFLAPHEDLCTVAGSQCQLHGGSAAEKWHTHGNAIMRMR